MGMPHAPTRWTAELVRALPDDGRRHELVAGELLVTPSPSPVHQWLVAAIFRRLDPYLVATGSGALLTAPADISLGEDEILQPDLFVLPPGQPLPPRDWAEVRRLQLAIEIVSPTTARVDRITKRRRFQRAGVPEYWIVDPDARVIERWRPEDTRPEVLSELLTWQPDPAHLPLEVDLPALFRETFGD